MQILFVLKNFFFVFFTIALPRHFNLQAITN